MLLALAGILPAEAQNSISPYSRMGYGLLGENATGIQRQMGGVGYAMQNGRQVNVMNPASYAQTDSLTFLWDIGLDFTSVWMEEGGKKGNSTGGGLDYITSAFRIADNLGASFGAVPFSSVGYTFGTDIDHGNVLRTGTGSVSELYLGFGWSPIKNLSIGANASYMFGTLQNYTLINSTSTSLFLRQMEIRDWNLHAGMQYVIPFNKKNRVTLGVTYSPKKPIHGHAWGSYYDAATDEKKDTVGYNSMKNNYELPNTIGAGLNYTHGNQWMAEVDFTYQDWTKAKYTPIKGFESANARFDDRWKVSGGIQFVPSARGSYLKRMAYRAGAYYNHDYQNFHGNNLRDYGVSLGFGFPALGSKTTVNLGFEYKHRYTAPTCLIKEDYFNVTLSVNFNEMWFWKNKIR